MSWGKKQPKAKKVNKVKKGKRPRRDSSTQYWFGGTRIDHIPSRTANAVRAHQATGREKRALASLEAAAKADPSARNKRAVAKYKKDHGL